MNRFALLEGLTEHAAGEIVIDAQKRIIASLTAIGSDTLKAEKTLEAFEQSQDLRIAEIDRLLDVLDKLPPVANEPKT